MAPRHKLSMPFRHSVVVRLCFLFICFTPFFVVSAIASTGAGPPAPVHPAGGQLPALVVATWVVSVVAALVSALEVIGDSPEYGPLVTGWDKTPLRELCLPSSPRYNPSLRISDIFQSSFPQTSGEPAETCCTPQWKIFLESLFFFPSTNHNYIQCSRFGSDSTFRAFSAGPLAQECTLKVYLRTMHSVYCPQQVMAATSSPCLTRIGKKKRASFRRQ